MGALYWPNMRADMINHRAMCSSCTKYAPSNTCMPPVEPEQPTYPFQSICADFLHIAPYNYLAIVDRYSNWLSIFKLPRDDSTEVVTILREYIGVFGIPCTLTTDGAKVFTSKLIEDFCTRWGIIHRVSTAYNPEANKRSEVGVKSAKRLIRGNCSQNGDLNTEEPFWPTETNLAPPLASHLLKLFMVGCSETSFLSNLANSSRDLSGDKLPRPGPQHTHSATLKKENKFIKEVSLFLPSSQGTVSPSKTKQETGPGNGIIQVLL